MACVRIERAENGFSVSMTDPKIEARNRKNSLAGKSGWQDPMREYVFESFDAMSKFLEKNLEKALPKDDFGEAFDSLSGDDD